MTPLAAMFAALGDCPPWYRPFARYQWRRRYVRTAIKVAAIAVLKEGAEEFVRLAFGTPTHGLHGDARNEKGTN